MKIDSGSEAGLHKMVADTQAGIAQMHAHHAMQRAWGYKKLSKQTKGRIDEVKDHLKSTMHYMAQREVKPHMQRAELSIAHDVPGQLEADLRWERQMVNDLNDFLSRARNAGEDSLRRMIEHVVKDNEQHVADLEAQLNVLNTIGTQNYLAKVSKV